MKFIRRLLLLTPFLVIIAVAWYWWSRPRPVDMAQYAPAEALVYLECNNLPAVVEGITATKAWPEFGATLGLKPMGPVDRWLTLAASLGIGPAEGVISARAQVAIVMLSLDTAEENTTLRIKPEGAIMIETHTSAWRIRPAVENLLQRFAERTYGQITPKRYREDADYLEWNSPAGDRKIVAAIDQSLVVVGNSKRVVQSCLEAARKQRANLSSDPALQLMRAKVQAAKGLTFGYISSTNAARLFSWAAPVFLGRDPGDSSLEQIINRSATRVLGAIGWSSHAINEGIEDRFFFSLEPPIVSRLQPVFNSGPANDSLWQVLPGEVESITIYKFESPRRAWQALRAVTAQLDALSAVVFGSVLQAALVPYGIEHPEDFLKAVRSELATLRLRKGTGNSVLFARVLDRSTLEQMFKWQRGSDSQSENNFAQQYIEVSGKRFAVAFINDYFVIGSPDDVRSCLNALKSERTIAVEDQLQILTGFAPDSSSSIVTYTSDQERVRNFFSALTTLRGSENPPTTPSADLTRLPYATTETSLGDQGIERRTRSTLGQFSNLITLLRRD